MKTIKEEMLERAQRDENDAKSYGEQADTYRHTANDLDGRAAVLRRRAREWRAAADKQECV